ncbi:MAG: formylmethanofuran dehydrogenase subunit C [Methanothrix sp.]|jgi:formylmethanofuran dehydrogenase subunit C|nr:formylmethanofuran dehydrogenase subunit C [Methanothrix sp.]
MAEIVLKPKGEIGITVEAEVIRPEMLAAKKKDEIERLQVWQGSEVLPLGDFFDVETTGDGSSEETTIVIDGDVPRVKYIGKGMRSGRIEIRGSAGMHVGAEMAGGSISVHGDALSWAGMEMKGGLLQIYGNAGDHVGSAYRGSWRGMTGGRILIEGNAKSQVGGGMAGGQIVVGGSVENFCAIRQNGGLILIRGDALRGLGAEMTGGTVAIMGSIRQFLPGFVEVGREESLKLGDLQIEGRFVKFSGDFTIHRNPKGLLYWREG